MVRTDSRLQDPKPARRVKQCPYYTLYCIATCRRECPAPGSQSRLAPGHARFVATCCEWLRESVARRRFSVQALCRATPSPSPAAEQRAAEHPLDSSYAAFFTASPVSRAIRFTALMIAFSDAVTISGLIPAPCTGRPLSTRSSTYDAAFASAPAPMACSW